ncbi:gluconokinase [Stutzerimonas tarimensis]|uniref:Gluconokinase n=1 Tax=Stutzerimonas tarimensis TaxID=1507735 RepID=A0ABV7T786_9GAMM
MIILVMGVSGSGKTTIGEALAARLGWGFSDADGFHSAENKARMAQGIALTDEDRWPWLEAIHQAMKERQREGRDHIFACSALKRVYRELLRENVPEVCMVYLAGSAELLAERLNHRRGHFFAPQLLADQLAVLEPPTADEALIADIRQTPEQIVEHIVSALDIERHS